MELNEQALRDILREQREEFQRHVDEGMEETRRHMGILVERAEHKIGLIDEGHDVLHQELGGIRDQLTDLQERVTRIEGYTSAIWLQRILKTSLSSG